MTPGNQNDELTMSILIAASQASVWQVLTKPEQMQRWLADEPLTIVVEWVVGGRYCVTGIVHRMQIENRGVVTEFVPEQKLGYAVWSSLSRSVVPDQEENRTHHLFVLESGTVGTILNLRVWNFPEATGQPHYKLYWGPTLQLIKKYAEQVEGPSV